MKSKVIRIQNPNGIHLRVAAKVVEASREHQSKITFYKDDKKASAQSILELVILEATHNSQITIEAEGQDEQKAIEKIEMLLIDGAGI